MVGRCSQEDEADRNRRLLDSFGHHPAACAGAGLLGWWLFALVSEGSKPEGACPPRSWLVTWTWVAEGLPLLGGAQVAVHATLSALSSVAARRGPERLTLTA